MTKRKPGNTSKMAKMNRTRLGHRTNPRARSSPSQNPCGDSPDHTDLKEKLKTAFRPIFNRMVVSAKEDGYDLSNKDIRISFERELHNAMNNALDMYIQEIHRQMYVYF